jgi:outer membrane protein OmpA-like peptidoglycan-associated protein
MATRLTLLVGVVAGLLALPAGAARADCTEINGEIKAALTAGGVADYSDLFDAMVAEPSCDAAYRDLIGRTMARSVLTTLAADSPPEAIRDATRYGRPWQVLVALGDSHYDRRDWAGAVEAYEEALDDMRDATANPRPPPEDLERRVYKRAIEARALAPVFVATRQFRGQKTGLASPVFRNFTAEVVPVPVRFEFDSAILTPEGAAAVEDIFAYLKDNAPDHVTIIGHTDAQGSDDYNLGLSIDRAEAVGSYLQQLGYGGTIETNGLGESQPFAADDPTKYSEDERFAFDRRVEYKLGK